METKLDVRKMEVLRVKLRFKFCFTVPSLGRHGGLALLWNDPAHITIHNFSQNHIDSHISLNWRITWRFTDFYGFPKGHRKRESWALLDKLHDMDSLSWLSMGDYNEIVSLEEKSGQAMGSMTRLRDFGDVLNRCELVDLGFRGVPFTWDNRRDGDALVMKRLDRAVANVRWMDIFNLCTVMHVVCSLRPCPTSSSNGCWQWCSNSKTASS